MSRTTRLFLFGDLTVPFEQVLRELLHLRDQPLLQSFFVKAAFALREEISQLPAHQQAWFPRFTTLIDILPNLNGKVAAPALKFALLCLCEVGLFIKYETEGPYRYRSGDEACVLGICTGSFAAAAVSVSKSLPELVCAAVEATLVAFRTAMVSLQCQLDVHNSTDTRCSSWSAIAGLKEHDASKLIEDFYKEKHLSPASKPYVSAISTTNVTISGPPLILKDLLATSKAQSRILPIESPYHAPHLFSAAAASSVVRAFHDQSLTSYELQIPLLSPAGGQVRMSSFKDILQDVVSATLQSQVRWDDVIETCRDLLQRLETSSCELVPFVSNAHQLLSSGLSQTSGLGTHTIDPAAIASPGPASSPLSSKRTGNFEHSKIAVIGFSGRYPDAASNEEFWQLLREGRDVHRTIPEDRFDWKAHLDPSGKARNTSRVQYGCFIKEPGLFDNRFFNLSPREAANTDPAQRLLLCSTVEALEMAGFVPNRTPSSQVDRVGVFMGTTSDDWREVNSGQDVDTYFIPGGNRAFIPGRISYFFKFSGPSLSIDTACSSSFSAIHAACTYLWKGDCDTAVAGGTNILTNPDNFAGLDRGHFLSTTGNCNAFDDGANGYCRADAIGSVILKRYEDAIADNDPIFGMIAGAHTNHCGQAESITRPHEGDQASVFNRILRYSNQNPLDVSYVEMHGTGTQAGDATEMNSVLSCFVPGKQRWPDRPLYIGSAKANIGHAESASGVSSLIKVLLMMKNNEIPPHCGIKTKINHNYPLDLTERNVNIAKRPTPWTREGCISGKRTAFLNNFSAAGGNTAMLLEDGPEKRIGQRRADLRNVYPVAITAKSPKSLEGNVKAMMAFLESHPDLSLESLSYTTTARRIQHHFRIVVSGSDIKSIRNNLQKKSTALPNKPIPNSALTPKVAFAFTGQGSLYLGVGKGLFESDASFQRNLMRFDTLAQQQGFPSFLPLVDGNLSEDQATQPVVAHIGHACIQMALCDLWKSWNVTPSLVIGHSLGEYAAFYAAGVTTAADTIYLVGTRARLLSESCSAGSHSMVSVKAPQSEVADDIRRSTCEVACVNQPDATVLSGSREEIDHLTAKLENRGRKCIKLDIPYAFHSAQVEPILSDFEQLGTSVSFSKPTVPFLSPLLGSVVNEEGILDASYLTKACRQTVNFVKALQVANESGMISEKTIWLELGPNPLCSGMIKSTMGSQTTTLPTLQKGTDTWASFVGSLETLYARGIELDWNEYHRQYAASYDVVDLPQYCWELKNYWIPYRNNFCLTKGDPPPSLDTPSEASQTGKAPIITPAVQRVVESDQEASKMVVESDINHPSLAAIIQGHKVNGVALCPSSLYADMAMTVAKQVLVMKGMPTDSVSFEVCNMRAAKPLVATGSEQLLRVSASLECNTKQLSLSFYSVKPEGRKLADHATCQVRVTQGAPRTEEWSRLSFLINHRVMSLQESVENGSAHKMKRGLVYKLFGSLVDYNHGYRGMEEVVLDSGDLEATARVRFQVEEEGFHLNPQWIDSLGHIAGFVMNGNDSLASKDSVFVNHGWDDMRISTTFSADKTYRTYNKMQLTENNLYVGDTYILEGENIVAVFSGVKFQGVPRRVLDQLLPPNSRPGQAPLPTAKAEVEAKKTSPPLEKSKSAMQSAQQKTPGKIQTRQPPSVSKSGIHDKILEIIAHEVGIEAKDLKPGTSLDECGVDSLLSLNISNMVQEQLGLTLSCSAFAEYSTIGAVLKNLAGPSADDNADSSLSQSSAPTSDDPDSIFDEDNTSTIASSEDELDEIAQTRSGDKTMATIKAVIAEEVGLETDEISSSTKFVDLGVDSLLTLNITSKLAEMLQDDLSNSLLTDNETLADIEKSLGLVPDKEAGQKFAAPAKAAKSMNERTANSAGPDSPPHATVHLLQGNPKTASKKLFLFPDGSGSAFSYANLSSVASSVAVYGIACPWQKDPWSMTGITFSNLSAKYIAAIRKVQPSGPYHLGGWSAGGISAYDAAQKLAVAGEETSSLVLLDSPNPIGLENPPQRMYDFLDSLDFFGMQGKKPPKWLRPHFDAFLSMLDKYEVSPWKEGKVPKTHILYAKDGICSNLKPGDPKPDIREDDPREMKWLMNTRTDFDAEGWKQLVGGSNLHVSVVEDVNHFTLMEKGRMADEIAAFIRTATDD